MKIETISARVAKIMRGHGLYNVSNYTDLVSGDLMEWNTDKEGAANCLSLTYNFYAPRRGDTEARRKNGTEVVGPNLTYYAGIREEQEILNTPYSGRQEPLGILIDVFRI